MASPWTNAELIKWTWHHVLWRTKRTTGWPKCSVEQVNLTERVDLFQHERDATVSWTGDVSVVHSVHLRLFMSSCAGRHCRSADVLMDTECSTAQSELSSAFCSDSTYYITCWSRHLNTTWNWWEIWYSVSFHPDRVWMQMLPETSFIIYYYCLIIIIQDRHWLWRKAAGVFRNRLCVFCENRSTASSLTQISLSFKVYISAVTDKCMDLNSTRTVEKIWLKD